MPPRRRNRPTIHSKTTPHRPRFSFRDAQAESLHDKRVEEDLIIFQSRVDQVANLGNFVIKAIVTVYGVALVGLLSSIPALAENHCFDNAKGNVGFLLMVAALVLGAFFSVWAAADNFLSSFNALLKLRDSSPQYPDSQKKHFSYLLGPNIHKGAWPVVNSFSVFFWCTTAFFIGLLLFLTAASCIGILGKFFTA